MFKQACCLLTMDTTVCKGQATDVVHRDTDWELRPGGMLVQRRTTVDAFSMSMIKIKVFHDSYLHHITVPSQSTFGELKRGLADEIGLDPEEQRLIFKGKEKEDAECLHMAGVEDMSKIILLEDPASRERKLKAMQGNNSVLTAYDAVSTVRREVDKLHEKVVALETRVRSGTKVADKEFDVLTELLMLHMLKLDSIEADGEAKVQRRIEVRRVQSFIDALDNLKGNRSNSFYNTIYAASGTNRWETFQQGVGKLCPSTQRSSSTIVTQNWELFD